MSGGSFFPGMLVKSDDKTVRSWLVNVNGCGEIVVYSLDKDGHASNFACGGVKTLAGPVAQAFPGHRIVRLVGEYSGNEPPWRPYDYEFYGVVGWAGVARAMNGSGVRAGRFRERFEILLSCKYDVPYIDVKNGKYFVTDKGIAADKKVKAKIAELHDRRHSDTDHEDASKAPLPVV